MNIVLIGFMGTGKSLISKLLAEKLGWKQLDTDELIVQQAGKTIREIFAEDGESHFRLLESNVLRQLQKMTDSIISTGGGIILDPSNRQLLKDLGKVVLLQATPQTIINRLGDDVSRPLLQGGNSEKLLKINKLLDTRKPLYAECAELTIDTSELTPEQIVEIIVYNCS